MAQENPPTGRIIEELLQSMNQEENLARLFERYYRPVVRFFARRGFSFDESRDLAQETFYRVVKSITSFKGESSFATWLFIIAARVYCNHLRDRSAQKRSAEEVPLENGQVQSNVDNASGLSDDALAELLAKERMQVLARELERLPPQARRCVFLRVDQGLKYREIARVLQITIGAVKSHLHQARQKLRERLGEYFDDVEL